MRNYGMKKLGMQNRDEEYPLSPQISNAIAAMDE